MQKIIPDLRHVVEEVDRALFRLLEERARLVETLGSPVRVAVDDILARHEGRLDAEAIRRVARAVDEAFGAKS